MINVKTSNDPRAGIQNGFWAIKFIIIIGGMIGSFFIPVGTFGKYPRNLRIISRLKTNSINQYQLSFFKGEVWMYFGMIGGFLFILIQLVLIIDFAHSWAEAWVGNYEENESKGNHFLAMTCQLQIVRFYTSADNSLTFYLMI